MLIVIVTKHISYPALTENNYIQFRPCSIRLGINSSLISKLPESAEEKLNQAQTPDPMPISTMSMLHFFIDVVK